MAPRFAVNRQLTALSPAPHPIVREVRTDEYVFVTDLDELVDLVELFPGVWGYPNVDQELDAPAGGANQ